VAQSVRALAKAPGFALAAVLVLALGIGANSALFTVLQAVLLRPPAYAAPERLVTWKGHHSAPDIADFGAQVPSLSSVGLFAGWPLDLVGTGGLPEQVAGALVTGGVFETLGVPALLGRTLGPADDVPGAPRVVVLGHALWRERFGADPSLLGRTVSFSGEPYTVIGVMPPGFRLPQGEAQAFVAAHVLYAEGLAARGAHFLYPLGRLRPGADLPAAQAQVAAVARRILEAHPGEAKGMEYVLQPLHARMVGAVRPTLLVLLGAVGLVLLVACFTFANLLLARASLRGRELAVRSALGASRRRLLGQLLCESVLLAGAGAGAGLVLCLWGVDGLRALAPGEVPGLDGAQVDGAVLGFTAGVALLTGVLSGLWPAWQASRPRLAGVLGAGGRTHTHGGGRARQGLVAGQVALAAVLLVGSGLLLRSFHRLSSAPLGFSPGGVLSLVLNLPPARYPTPAAQQPLLQGLLERTRALPGVEGAALVSELPLTGSTVSHALVVQGAPPPAPGDAPDVQVRVVSDGYFELMRIPLLQGRGPGAADSASAPPVAVVNRAFADAHLQGPSPLGRRVRWVHGDAERWMTVVGVVGDIRHQAPDAVEGPTVYVPLAQNDQAWKRWSHLVVRAPEAALAGLGARVQEQSAAVDPLLPLTQVRTLEQVLSKSLQARRFQVLLLGGFALLALVLATLGVYGVTAFLVAERTREFGIRMALGAAGVSVLGLVLRQALVLVGAGLAVGLLGAAALSGSLAALLYGVPPVDLPTYAAIAGGLALVGLVASAAPAWRAVRVDPALCLRAE
jgi:predicted permease